MKKALGILIAILVLNACTTIAPEYTILNKYGTAVEFRFGVKTGETIKLDDGAKTVIASYFQPNIYFVPSETNDFSDAKTSFDSSTKLVTITKEEK